MYIFLQKTIEDVAKTSKPSSSYMEIEIHELLYALMASYNHESSSQKLEETINHNSKEQSYGDVPTKCSSHVDYGKRYFYHQE